MRVLAIATKYKHHSKTGGYIQLAKYLKTDFLIGVDETRENKPLYFLRAYKWLYEWLAYFKFRGKVDLVHIYYGEEYFRFSTFLFPNTPVVVTFHQPPTRLKYEIEKGGTGGRIARLTHQLTIKRFRRLAAAIVLEESQKEILKQVMDEDRIHIIYHGIDLQEFQHFQIKEVKKASHQVITVGNWLRDWKFYEQLLKIALEKYPQLKFVLVNRPMDQKILKKLQENPNFEFKNNLTDGELTKEIRKSKVHFLPLIEATANNSVMESLAIGCPLVLPDIFSAHYQLKNKAISFFPVGQVERALDEIWAVIQLKDSNYQESVNLGYEKIKHYDWSKIAERTLEIYKKVCKQK